jgi:PAS domain S-box-containing protein
MQQQHAERRGGRVRRLARSRAGARLYRRSELILNAAAEGIYGIDREGLVTYVNPAAERMLGWSAHDLVGRSMHDTVHHSRHDGSPYPADSCPIQATARDGVTHRVHDEVFWRREGSPCPVEYTSTPIIESGDLCGAVVMFRDITDRKEASKLYGQVLRLSEQQAEQNDMVVRLQQALFPAVPVADEFDLGVHFLSAEPSMPTGGDMYDVQILPDGDLHVVVLDVMGKGVEATTGALALVHTLRVLVAENCPMERLVGRADELLTAQDPSFVATVMVARYTPSTGRLRLAGGGHPPVVIVTPDARLREVTAPGIAIGWPGAGSGQVVEEHLGRLDTAVFYTDGLIESTKDVIAGLASLHDAARETVGYPARHLARSLVERALADAERHDDTLALVLRRRTPMPDSGIRRLGPFTYRFSASPATVSLARHFFGDWLAHQPADPGCRDDLLVMVSELCTNAVREATAEAGSVVLRAWDHGDALIVEVEDDGNGMDPDAIPTDERLPDPDAPEGRGLFLVQALADEVEVQPRESGTVVRCVKRAVLPAR